MANVENLGKLERRVTISLPKDTVQKEVDSRIRQLAKNVRMPGFRPGKVPLKMVTQQYQGQVEAEVLSDKVGKEFFDVTRAENLRVAGQPSFAPKGEEAPADAYAFDATFEVYPEVKLGDVATAEIERTVTTISEARNRPHAGNPAQAARALPRTRRSAASMATAAPTPQRKTATA